MNQDDEESGFQSEPEVILIQNEQNEVENEHEDEGENDENEEPSNNENEGEEADDEVKIFELFASFDFFLIRLQAARYV